MTAIHTNSRCGSVINFTSSLIQPSEEKPFFLWSTQNFGRTAQASQEHWNKTWNKSKTSHQMQHVWKNCSQLPEQKQISRFSEILKSRLWRPFLVELGNGTWRLVSEAQRGFPGRHSRHTGFTVFQTAVGSFQGLTCWYLKKGLMSSNVGNYFFKTKNVQRTFKLILGYCRIDHGMRHSNCWFQLSLISHCVFLVVAGCFILKQEVPVWSDLLSWKPVINRLVPCSLRITDPLLGPTQRLPWCGWWKQRHVAGRPRISPDRRSELSHKWNWYKRFYN